MCGRNREADRHTDEIPNAQNEDLASIFKNCVCRVLKMKTCTKIFVVDGMICDVYEWIAMISLYSQVGRAITRWYLGYRGSHEE